MIENVTGYIDGEPVTYTADGSTYTASQDCDTKSEYPYSITATDDVGNSTTVSRTFYSGGWVAPITDRTLDDVIKGNDKGFLNYTDLNRIEIDSGIISDKLWEIGYIPHELVTKEDWVESDMPYLAELTRVLEAVKYLRDWFYKFDGELPTDMQNLTYIDLNQIETKLKQIYLFFQTIDANTQPYCGTFNCGEVVL